MVGCHGSKAQVTDAGVTHETGAERAPTDVLAPGLDGGAVADSPVGRDSPNNDSALADGNARNDVGGLTPGPDGNAADGGASERPTADLRTGDVRSSDGVPDVPNTIYDGSVGEAGIAQPWSGTQIQQLSTDKALELFVAKDEGHVAYSTNRSESSAFGCLGRNAVGDLKTIVTDPTPAVALIDSYAGFREAFFTDDSLSMFFTKYTQGTNPCADLVYFRSAPSKGGTGSISDSNYYYHSISVAGASALWQSFGGGASDPGTWKVGKVGSTGRSLGSTGSPQIDPTGSFVMYEGGGEVRLATATGTTKMVLNDGSLGLGIGFVWSPDGMVAAYAHHPTTTSPVVLEIINTDGSGRQTVSSDCRCGNMVFSPDSARLAFDIIASDGTYGYVVQPVSGAAPVTLTGLTSAPGTAPMPAFSPDGTWLEVVDGYNAVYAAATARAGTFVRLSSAQGRKSGAFATTAGHAFLAFLDGDAAGTGKAGLVVTTPSGQSKTPFASGVTGVWYEQTATSPRLAVAATDDSGAPAMFLLPADGSLPGKRLSAPPAASYPTAFWIGTVLVYETNLRAVTGSPTLVDLIAASDDGSQEGTLATEAVLHPKTGRPSAARLFFARGPTVGGGVYMFAPPVGPVIGTGGTGGGTGGARGTGGAGGQGGSSGFGGGTGHGGSGAGGASSRGGATGTGGSGGTGGTVPPCAGTLTFSNLRYSTQSGSTEGVAIGDVNRDGKPDVVVANLSGGVVTVMLGGSGLAYKIAYYVDDDPAAVALGDLSGDGILDIVVTSVGGNYRILRGVGDGTFDRGGLAATGAGPLGVATGDFDGNGALDFATACSGAGTVVVFANEGKGVFSQHFPFAAAKSVAALATGDFNQDGLLDFATASTAVGTMSVFLNSGADGSARFANRTDHPTGDYARSIAAGDLDGDGWLDLVVSSVTSGTVGTYLNQGDGTFAEQTTSAAGTSPISIVLADFDGDGKLDAAVGSSTGTGVSLLLGLGNGTFAAPVTFPTTDSIQFVATADMNGDGRPDLVTANGDNTVSLMLAACQ